MTNTPFNAKNGIIANGTFYANSSSIIIPPTASLTVNNSVGSNGYFLGSNGSTAIWSYVNSYSFNWANPQTFNGVIISPGTEITLQDGTQFDTANFSFRNKIINGSFAVQQYSNNINGFIIDRFKFVAPPTSTLYTPSQWGVDLNMFGSGSHINNANALPTTYCLSVYSTAQYTPASSEAFAIEHTIDSSITADLAWGTSNANNVTLSFWAYSSLTGNFGGSITGSVGSGNPESGYNNGYFYPFQYNIPVANTWTKISVNIPGPTNFAGNISVFFSLGSGSNYTGTLNSWNSTTSSSVIYLQPPGVVNIASAPIVSGFGANFSITAIQLEKGNVSTPFETKPYSSILLECQRFMYARTWNGGDVIARGYGVSGSSSLSYYLQVPTTMINVPSVSDTSSTSVLHGTNLNTPVPSYESVDQQGATLFWLSSGTGIAKANVDASSTFSVFLQSELYNL